MLSARLLCPLLVFAASSLIGCSGNENLTEVIGTITLDGQPLDDALVVFSPTSGGTTSYGRTDSEGHYRMMFKDDEPGAWKGQSVVRISTGDVGGTGGAGKPERVPQAYNAKSNEKVEVAAGENVHNFALKSNASKVVQLPKE